MNFCYHPSGSTVNQIIQFLQWLGEMSQQVDEPIINKIHQFVNEGLSNVREMQRHMKIFVKNELFHGTSLPPPTSRRYHPKKKDIRNRMYIAAAKLKFSKTDQKNLELKVKEWKKQSLNDNFFFRGYGSIHERRLEPDKIGTTDTDSDEVTVSSILATYFEILSFCSKDYHISSTNQVFKCS